MTSRILPQAEWPRLEGTEAGDAWPSFDPLRTAVVVVERDGAIVGCHVLMYILHAECLWLAESERGKGTAARRLWCAVRRQARALGARAFWTAAVDDKVRGLLEHVSAVPVPGAHYCVPVSEGR